MAKVTTSLYEEVVEEREREREEEKEEEEEEEIFLIISKDRKFSSSRGKLQG